MLKCRLYSVKSFLDSSEHFENAKHNFANHGIIINEPQADLARMVARKNEVVDQTTKGINFLMDKNKVTVFEGLGSFESATQIKVTKNDGSSEILETKYAIVATGSKPSTLPFITIDKERIITSTEALNLKKFQTFSSNWWWCNWSRIGLCLFEIRFSGNRSRIYGQNYSNNGWCFV